MKEVLPNDSFGSEVTAQNKLLDGRSPHNITQARARRRRSLERGARERVVTFGPAVRRATTLEVTAKVRPPASGRLQG